MAGSDHNFTPISGKETNRKCLLEPITDKVLYINGDLVGTHDTGVGAFVDYSIDGPAITANPINGNVTSALTTNVVGPFKNYLFESKDEDGNPFPTTIRVTLNSVSGPERYQFITTGGVVSGGSLAANGVYQNGNGSGSVTFTDVTEVSFRQLNNQRPNNALTSSISVDLLLEIPVTAITCVDGSGNKQIFISRNSDNMDSRLVTEAQISTWSECPEVIDSCTTLDYTSLVDYAEFGPDPVDGSLGDINPDNTYTLSPPAIVGASTSQIVDFIGDEGLIIPVEITVTRTTGTTANVDINNGVIGTSNGNSLFDISVTVLPDVDGNVFSPEWGLGASGLLAAEQITFNATYPAIDYIQGAGGINVTVPYVGDWNNANNAAASYFRIGATSSFNFSKRSTNNASGQLFLSMLQGPDSISTPVCEAIDNNTDRIQQVNNAVTSNTTRIEVLENAVVPSADELTDTFILGEGSVNADTIVAFLPDNVSRNFVATGVTGSFNFSTGITIINGVVTNPANSPLEVPLGATGYVYRNNAGDAVIVYQTVPSATATTTVQELALYAAGSVPANGIGGYGFSSTQSVASDNIYTIGFLENHPQMAQYSVTATVQTDTSVLYDQAKISIFNKGPLSFQVAITVDDNEGDPDVNIRRSFDYQVTYEKDVEVEVVDTGLPDDGDEGLGIVGDGDEVIELVGDGV